MASHSVTVKNKLLALNSHMDNVRIQYLIYFIATVKIPIPKKGEDKKVPVTE